MKILNKILRIFTIMACTCVHAEYPKDTSIMENKIKKEIALKEAIITQLADIIKTDISIAIHKNTTTIDGKNVNVVTAADNGPSGNKLFTLEDYGSVEPDMHSIGIHLATTEHVYFEYTYYPSENNPAEILFDTIQNRNIKMPMHENADGTEIPLGATGGFRSSWTITANITLEETHQKPQNIDFNDRTISNTNALERALDFIKKAGPLKAMPIKEKQLNESK